MKKHYVTVGVVAGALFLAGCGSAEGEAGSSNGELETSTITYGQFASGAGSREVFAADRLGYFDDVGLDIEYEQVGVASDLIPLMTSSQVDIGYMGYSSAFMAMNAGVDLRLVSHYQNLEEVNALFVASDSGIDEVADLEGQRIGLSGVGGYSDILVGEALAEVGLSLDDVELAEVAAPNVLTAMETGDIEAGQLMGGFIPAAELDPDERGELLTYFSDVETLDGLPQAGDIAAADFVEDNPATVEAFNEAVSRAAGYLDDNPDFDRELQIDLEGLDDDVAEDLFFQSYLGDVSGAELQRYADLMIDYGMLEEDPDIESFLGSE